MPIVRVVQVIEGEVLEIHWLAKTEPGRLVGQLVATERRTCPPKSTQEARADPKPNEET